MTVLELKEFLICSTLINYAIILLWFGVFARAHDWLYGMHTRWFKLTVESFDAMNYGGLAVYKTGIVLLNLVPLIALCFIS